MRRRQSRSRCTVLSVALVALASVVVGCGGSLGPNGSSNEPSRSRLKDAHSSSRARQADIPTTLEPKPTPIEAYLETPRQAATLDYATQVLAAACMRDRGFDTQVPKFQDLVEWHEQQAAFDRARWFGLTDRAEVAVYGYGEPPLPANPSPDLSAPGASSAYRGQGVANPADPACRPQAEAQLYDVEKVSYDASTLPEKLEIQAAARATARADYGDVYGDLGRCLKAAGYDIPDPEKPFASKAMQQIMGGGMDREQGEPAPRAEIRAALADIDCKVKVNLVRRLERIVSEEQSRLIEKNALALQEYAQDLQGSLRRATRVMDGKAIR